MKIRTLNFKNDEEGLRKIKIDENVLYFMPDNYINNEMTKLKENYASYLNLKLNEFYDENVYMEKEKGEKINKVLKIISKIENQLKREMQEHLHRLGDVYYLSKIINGKRVVIDFEFNMEYEKVKILDGCINYDEFFKVLGEWEDAECGGNELNKMMNGPDMEIIARRIANISEINYHRLCMIKENIGWLFEWSEWSDKIIECDIDVVVREKSYFVTFANEMTLKINEKITEVEKI